MYTFRIISMSTLMRTNTRMQMERRTLIRIRMITRISLTAR